MTYQIRITERHPFFQLQVPAEGSNAAQALQAALAEICAPGQSARLTPPTAAQLRNDFRGGAEIAVYAHIAGAGQLRGALKSRDLCIEVIAA